MNDINSITEHLLPISFVHISCEMFKSGPVIKCTYKIYKFLQHFVNEQYIGDDEELDTETSCMHCRFFNEHLLNAYETRKPVFGFMQSCSFLLLRNE